MPEEMPAKSTKTWKSGRGRGLTIRQIASQAGVTSATVHHYVSLGLLPTPERPHRRMAFYDPVCIEQIARIKALQKRFLPLSVIKQLLDSGGDRGLREADAKLLEQMDLTETKEARDEVLRRYPVEPHVLSVLAEQGLITGNETLTADEVAIVAAVHQMREAGMDERMGFSAAQLDFYCQIIEQLIDREFATFNEKVLGRVTPAEEVRLARISIDASTRLITALHHRMLREHLAEIVKFHAGSASQSGPSETSRTRRDE
jgi:DNA-binding transcriptional MerR regulator